jgi:serine/threonine-protein kinase
MDSSLETRTGELKGKVAYMPPEQASGKRVDRRADIFAVGVMLWEAATGRRMWKGLNEMAIMHALFAGEIPSPRSVDPRVPEDLDRICRIALSPTPEYRYSTAAEMAAELENYCAQIGDRSGARDISRLVSEAFEADRKEMKDIIDGQLRMLRTSESQARAVPKADLTGLVAPSDAHSVPRVSTAQLDASAASSFTAGGTASSMKQVPVAPAPPKTPRVVAALMAVSAVGLVAVLATVAWQHRGNDTAAAAKPADSAAAPTPTVPVAAPGAPRTKVALSASPPDAKLFIDDAPLDANPYNGAFPKDGLAHRVRAEAKDYVARTEVIEFDKDDATVNLTLQKRSQVGSIYTAGVKPAPKPSVDPAPDPAASVKKKPHRDIDTTFGSGAP